MDLEVFFLSKNCFCFYNEIAHFLIPGTFFNEISTYSMIRIRIRIRILETILLPAEPDT